MSRFQSPARLVSRAMRSPALAALLAIACTTPLLAQEAPGGARGQRPDMNAGSASAATAALGAIPPSVTHHTIEVGGKRLAYTATAGTLPLRTEAGDTEAEMFYIAYTLDGDHKPGTRPLTFAFNGGPGAASVWLHLGALGPRRIVLKEGGNLPQPPFRLTDNEYTWLTDTDLVFIDPVGTGYSRAAKPDIARKYWGVNGDLDSISEFVQLYLSRNERWSSPLFVCGESYGTTRAAGLAGRLIDRGVALNGVLLISTVLNFQTISFSPGNELPYVLFLPSYTAAAWFHKRLPPDLQRDLPTTLHEVEDWAQGPYAQALAKGTSLPAAEREAVIDHLARYTGLDRRFIEDRDLRIPEYRFTRELLRNEKRSIGRFDDRIVGDELPPGRGEGSSFDPSLAAVRPVFTSTFNDYVRRELRLTTDRSYYILGEGIHGPWDWDVSGQGYTDTSAPLRDAFAKNPYMKLFVGSGYFDLATPYFGTRYTVEHLGLNPALRANVTERFYQSGHMVYTEISELARLKADVSAFMKNALRRD